MSSDGVDALQVGARRRRWSGDVKAQIVAESCAPDTVVSEVTRRHEISPQLLSAWRKAYRHGLLLADSEADDFAQLD
jgi:transposase